MKAINYKNIIAPLAALLLALGACDNHDYYRLPTNPDGTPIENPGRLHLSGIPEGHTAMLLNPDKDNLLMATVVPGQPVDVEEGSYTLIYISPATEQRSGKAAAYADSGYTLQGLLFTLPLLSADGLLPQLPDVNTDGTGVTILRDHTHLVSLNPAPLTRAVQLDVALLGTEMSTISSIEARLYGVRRSTRLDEGFSPLTRAAEEDAVRGSATNVYYHSILLSDTSGSTSAADPTVSGSFRLLGIDLTAHQRILISATQKDGTITTFEQDVSDLLMGFNPPASAATLRLTATLNFGINEITGTINPWKPGWNDGGTGI